MQLKAKTTENSSMFSHKKIWRAIDLLAEQHKLSASGLARKAGLDPTSFNKSKRQGHDGRLRWPSTESIAKILNATQTSIDMFVDMLSEHQDLSAQNRFWLQQSTIPLLGFTQAGTGGFFDDGGNPVGKGWDIVEFPTTPDQKMSVYALEVQGDSMMPLYRDGDVLIIDPAAQLRRNDRIIVKTTKGQVTANILIRRTARTLDLASLNPDNEPCTLNHEEIEWTGRIIWASQ